MNSRIDGRRALFAKLADPQSQPEFWAHVAEDVDWTVEGTHPLAGRYNDKARFIESTFNRLAGVLPAGVRLEVRHLYLDGDTAIVELHATSTTNEGAAFANNYCWVCRFKEDTIVEVRAYLDSMMVAYTILRNEPTSHRAERVDGGKAHGLARSPGDLERTIRSPVGTDTPSAGTIDQEVEPLVPESHAGVSGTAA